MATKTRKQISTVEARTFEDAALLRSKGFDLAGAEVERGRVVLRFSDPHGEGEAILQAHGLKGLEVNSLSLLDALRWAKDTIFRARRRGGLD